MRRALSGAREQVKDLELAISTRLEAACPVVVGGVYRVKRRQPFTGDSVREAAGYLLRNDIRLHDRIVKVCTIRAQRCGIGNDAPVELRVSVRAKLVGKRATPTSDGFGRKWHWIDPERLEPIDG